MHVIDQISDKHANMIFYNVQCNIPLDSVWKVIFFEESAPHMIVATGYCVDAMILSADMITVWPFSLVTLCLTAYVLGRLVLDTFVSVPLNDRSCSGKPPCLMYSSLFHSRTFEPRTIQVKNISWLLYAIFSFRVLFNTTSWIAETPNIQVHENWMMIHIICGGNVISWW
jgi:hypothetical protein